MRRVTTDFHNLYSSSNFVMKVTSELRLRGAGEGGRCGTKRSPYQVLVKTVKKRDHSHDLDKDGRTILKLIPMKQFEDEGTGTGGGGGFFERGNENS